MKVRSTGFGRPTEATPIDPGSTPVGKTLAYEVKRLTLRLDDVARSLGVSRRAIERERSAGRFPKPDRTVGRMPLWRPETIETWLNGGGR